MKKITSVVLLLATLFLILSMSGCKKKQDGVPDGMQLVMGGENDAFSFFGPEEWIVSNYGNIACTYASKVNMTSMTFTEISIPDGKIRNYFESEKTKFPYAIKMVDDGVDCSFGNAAGIKYVYTYTYQSISYTCMQIFTENRGRFYIFTYTAANEQRMGGATYYEYYLDKVKACIDAFKFHANDPLKKDEATYEKDANGYLIVSDKTLSGFVMHVPDSYKVDCSTAFVSVSKDGVNITMTESTYPTNSLTEYWEKKRADIEAIADKIPSEDGKTTVTSFTELKESEKVDAGNADAAADYAYSYVLDGVKYRVYQIIVRSGVIGGKVYVYSYIATDDCYDLYFDEMKDIFGKIEF